MNGTVSRRVFVGSVAAGLPLVVGESRGVIAQSPADQSHIHPDADGSPDAMFEHASRQLATLADRIRRGGVAGEDMRLAAMQVSTLVIYAQQIQIDVAAKRALSDLVRAKGRDAVLAQDIDRSWASARLKAYGVDADEIRFGAHKADYPTRVKALEDVSRDGLSGLLAHVASTFEQIGETLDGRSGGAARISRVQLDAAWKQGFCDQLSREIARLEADASIICALGYVYPPIEAVCAMISVALGIQLMVYVAYC